MSNHAHFCTIKTAIASFLDEKMNYKSNGIDLEAIEAYSLIVTASLVPSPSYAKREKGSGEKGRTTVSLWNAINGVLVCVK